MQSLKSYSVSSPSSSSSSRPGTPPTAVALPSSAPPADSSVGAEGPADQNLSSLAAQVIPMQNGPRKLPHGSAQAAAVDPSAFERNLYSFGGPGQVDPTTGQVLPGRPAKRPRTSTVRRHVENVPSGATRASGPSAPRSSGDDRVATENLIADGAEMNSEQRGTVLMPTTELILRGPRGGSWEWFKRPAGSRTFEDLETYTPYIPRRVVHSFPDAHGGKGVGSVRFFPGTGHLLLSAGLEGSAKVWEVGDGRRGCARKYAGHGKGIRDICWSGDGTSFLTASYDCSLLLWDTEYGKVKGRFTGTGGIPYCVKFNPDKDKATEFLAGCSDKKVIQMDVRNGNKIVQSYDQHMGAVNSIAFVDDNRRFVTSADDKVLRVWDYGIPVVIKYISDPTMHSMPVVSLHPNGKWISCQGMDNSVSVYSVRDRFRLNPKKRFSGHLVAGYACGLTYSPDGRFLASGDSMGRAFFWDWKTAKMFRALKGHKGVCIDISWHPTESSRVATCGWDGYIKLWD